VFIGFSTTLGGQEVFLNNIFYSLSAIERGGAIFTNAPTAVKNCKFFNNSAGNNEGNDIFANVTTDYFTIASNIQYDCSVSYSPGKLMIANLV
jgi:hypothetical protein